MNLGVVFEKVEDPGFPPGFYYAHVPSLGLTTHGEGVENARKAAVELVQLWISEKKAAGERIVSGSEFLFSTLEIPDDALQSA